MRIDDNHRRLHRFKFPALSRLVWRAPTIGGLRCRFPKVAISRSITIAFAFSILATVLACDGNALAAQGSGVQLELTPTAVQLGSGESTQVMAVIRNNGGTSAQNMQIHWFTDLALTVKPQAIRSRSIQPGGMLAWPVTISQSVAGRTVGPLHFWVSYTTRSETSGSGKDEVGISGVAVASLDVQERASLAVDKLVTLKLEAAVDQLDENRSALLYVVVTNTAAVPVTVKAIETYSPDFIKFGVPEIGSNATLAPETSRTFRVPVTVTDRVVTGNQRVVLAVELAWVDAGKPRTGTLSVAQTLPVTVFGESDLLKLMGVPSFLFLPGFLALATFVGLWTRVAPRTKPAEPLTVADTALVAITLSLLATFVYPILSGRNYLRGYGLRDVMMVWFGSILFALVVWSGVAGTISLRAKLRRYQQQQAQQRDLAAQAEHIGRITPTKNDSPLDMLTRMALNGVQVPPEQAMASLAGSTATRCFVVLPSASAGAPVWVAPPIYLKRDATNPQAAWTQPQLLSELQKDGVTGNCESLMKFLRNAQLQGWSAEWGESGVVVSPTPVKTDDVNKVPPAQGFEFVQAP